MWGGSVDDDMLYMMDIMGNVWVVLNTIGTPPSPRINFPYFIYAGFFYIFPGKSYDNSQFLQNSYRINLEPLVWELILCD